MTLLLGPGSEGPSSPVPRRVHAGDAASATMGVLGALSDTATAPGVAGVLQARRPGSGGGRRDAGRAWPNLRKRHQPRAMPTLPISQARCGAGAIAESDRHSNFRLNGDALSCSARHRRSGRRRYRHGVGRRGDDGPQSHLNPKPR